MEQVLFVATGVASLRDAVPPAEARGWSARPADGALSEVLGTGRPAVEFRREDVPFSVVVVESRRFGPVTVLAEGDTNEAVRLRRSPGADFQRACCLGYPAVLDLLHALRHRRVARAAFAT